MRAAEINRNVGRNGFQEWRARIPHDTMRQRFALFAVKQRGFKVIPRRRLERNRRLASPARSPRQNTGSASPGPFATRLVEARTDHQVSVTDFNLPAAFSKVAIEPPDAT
jgi:hypothetical protein